MIYITGDTHCPIDIKKLNTKNFPIQKELNKKDYVIICGDVGIVWNENSKEDKYWQKWLNQKTFTTLFVDGNHDNHELLNSYAVTEWNDGKVHFINENVIHLMRGQVFNIDNKKIFTMGGAESIDKNNRKPGISWWPGEMPSYQEYEEGLDNLDKNNWKVDYVITHTCSNIMFEELSKYMIGCQKYTTNLNKYFDLLEGKLEFKHWFFGHFHEDEKMDDKHTVIYHKILELEV